MNKYLDVGKIKTQLSRILTISKTERDLKEHPRWKRVREYVFDRWYSGRDRDTLLPSDEMSAVLVQAYDEGQVLRGYSDIPAGLLFGVRNWVAIAHALYKREQLSLYTLLMEPEILVDGKSVIICFD